MAHNDDSYLNNKSNIDTAQITNNNSGRYNTINYSESNNPYSGEIRGTFLFYNKGN